MKPPRSQATDLSPWATYQPSDAAPWNLQRVVHLHRRAGFAAPWPVLERDLADGPEAAVDRVLAGEASSPRSADDFERLAATIGDAAMASGNPGRLKAWWLYWMLLSPDPLAERLALMWHNHFATSNLKVQNLVPMRDQNERFRRLGRAPFGELLAAVVKHPAMFAWLDADSNRKGRANENLARELLELFTLGIGNYGEDDIKEAARALTGWTIADNRATFSEARHDDGEKVVLDKRGRLTGDDLLELLIEHPATARRLAWRITHTFFGEGVVDEEALDELAVGLTEHDLDVDWAVSTVLRSRLFFCEENLRSRVAGPVEYVVGGLRALELCDPPPSTLLLAEWTARMGQDLFYPPNVGGWPEGRAWLASRTIVARANFAAALTAGQLWNPSREQPLEALVERYDAGNNLDEAIAWFATLFWGIAPPETIAEIAAGAEATPSDQQFSTAVALILARPESQLM